MGKKLSLNMALMLVFTLSLPSFSMSCCTDEDKELYVRPWADNFKSYIKTFDNRAVFRLLNVYRNGTKLQADYEMPNKGFLPRI